MSTELRISPKIVAEALAEYTPGKVPIEVWWQIQRLNGSIIVDIVPYRKRDGKIQFFTQLHPPDDPFFGGQNCLPGKVAHGLDTSEEGILQRLIETELPDFILDEPENVTKYMRRNPRAFEFVSLYMVNVHEGGNDNSWINVEGLYTGEHSDYFYHVLDTVIGALNAKGQKRQTAAFE